MDCPESRPIRRVGLYIRYSSEEQRANSFSEEMQHEQCMQRLRQVHGEGPFGVKVFRDLAKTGVAGTLDPVFNGGDHRQGLTDLLHAVADGELDLVLCYSQDRLARDEFLWHYMNTTIFQRYSIPVLFARDGHDLSTEEGQMLASIHALAASLERRKISRNLKAACELRAHEGYHHSTAPFGWERDPDHAAVARQRRPLIRNEAQGIVLLEMKDHFLSGWPTVSIARDLNGRGIPSASGEPRWTPGSVRVTLINPVHAGLVKHRDQLLPAQHAPLRYWSPEDREHIIRRIRERAHRRHAGPDVEQHLLAGVIYCGHCGRRLQGCMDHTRSRRYYRCTSPRSGARERRRTGKTYDGYRTCPGLCWNADWLEAAVLRAIADLARSPQVQGAAEGHVADALDLAEDRMAGELKAITGELTKARQGFSLLFGLLDQGKITQAEFDTENTQRREKEEALARRQQDLQERIGARRSRRADLERAVALLRDFDRLWASLLPGERRYLLQQVDGHMTLRREADHLLLTIRPGFADPIEIPLPLRADRPASERTPVERLTQSHLALLHAWQEGVELTEIAERWGIQPKTMHSHTAAIRKTLGVRTMDEALEVEGVAERVAVWGASPQIRPSRPWRRRTVGHVALSAPLKAILQLLAEGKGCVEIAAALGKDKSTISRQTKQLCEKLGVNNPEEALEKARRTGLV